MSQNENKFDAIPTTKSVSTIILESNIKNIPAYQRDIVWDDQKMSLFINSILRGIIPMPLIFNINSETNTSTCIDGQQRITSLIKFRNNEIPVELDGEILFYDKVNENYKKPICRVMKLNERSKFNTRKITVIEYMDLEYEDQLEIFQRIQNGMALKKGELIASKFKDSNLSLQFTKFCDDNHYLIKNYVRKFRKEHIRYISHIFYILNNAVNSFPGCKESDNFIKNIKTGKELNRYLEYTESTLKVVFSDKILGDIYFSDKKINSNLLLTFLTFYKEKYPATSAKLKKMDDIEYCKFRYCLKKSINDCISSKIGASKTKSTFSKIYKIIKYNYLEVSNNKKLLSKELSKLKNISKKSSFDYNTENESDESEELDETEDDSDDSDDSDDESD